MYRLARILVITVGVVIIAWVIKEVFGISDGKEPGELVQKIRMSGI